MSILTGFSPLALTIKAQFAISHVAFQKKIIFSENVAVSGFCRKTKIISEAPISAETAFDFLYSQIHLFIAPNFSKTTKRTVVKEQGSLFWEHKNFAFCDFQPFLKEFKVVYEATSNISHTQA